MVCEALGIGKSTEHPFLLSNNQLSILFTLFSSSLILCHQHPNFLLFLFTTRYKENRLDFTYFITCLYYTHLSILTTPVYLIHTRLSYPHLSILYTPVCFIHTCLSYPQLSILSTLVYVTHLSTLSTPVYLSTPFYHLCIRFQ